MCRAPVVKGIVMEKYDKKDIYCRMLGHRIEFLYCRTAKEGIPCRKITDCWFENFNVKEFVDQNYSEEIKEKIFAPPVEKVASLLDLIEKARKTVKK